MFLFFLCVNMNLQKSSTMQSGQHQFAYFFFSIFCLKRKYRHLASRVSIRMQNKSAPAQISQRTCILHKFLTSCKHEKARLCRLISVFIFRHQVLNPPPEGGEKERETAYFLNINLLTFLFLNSKFTRRSFRQ